MSTLILNTIIWPLGFGALLGLAAGSGIARGWLLSLAFAAAMLALYMLLEGPPVFPPVAAKQKLFYLIAGAAPWAVLCQRRVSATPLLVAAYLAVALVWLGWNKFASAGPWPLALPMLAPVLAAAVAARSITARAADTFLWPCVLLAYAIGAALLSLLGVFVGFAQALGAMAALLGGCLAVLYVLGFTRRGNIPLAAPLVTQLLLGIVCMSFMAGLFAPDISLSGFATLSLALVVPLIAPSFNGAPSAARPFLYGLMAAAPAAAAVLIAR